MKMLLLVFPPRNAYFCYFQGSKCEDALARLPSTKCLLLTCSGVQVCPCQMPMPGRRPVPVSVAVPVSMMIMNSKHYT